MSEDEERKKLIDMVQKAAMELGEHVDTVQIFVCKLLDGGKQTRTYEYGTGLYHARLGQVQEWLTAQDEYTREWVRAAVNEENNE